MKKLKQEIRRRSGLEDKGYLVDERGRLIHRVVCRDAYGEFPKDWVVHHVDRNKTNNTPENLIAVPRKLLARILSVESKKLLTFTRHNIESMVRAYTNLGKNKEVQITITVSSAQIQSTDLMPVTTKLVDKSNNLCHK